VQKVTPQGFVADYFGVTLPALSFALPPDLPQGLAMYDALKQFELKGKASSPTSLSSVTAPTWYSRATSISRRQLKAG